MPQTQPVGKGTDEKRSLPRLKGKYLSELGAGTILVDGRATVNSADRQAEQDTSENQIPGRQAPGKKKVISFH
jgi:hypothetical protein